MIVVLFAVIGNFLGSGFISGKEIAVFFSRFGSLSFLSIPLTFFIFWGVVYLILNKCDVILSKLSRSRFCAIINIIICLVFSASMLAGISSLLKFNILLLNLFSILIILFVCIFIIKKGLNFLNKMNNLLIPIMFSVFFIILCLNISPLPLNLVFSKEYLTFPLYSLLYVILNTSNGCVLIASLGKSLSKRQKAQVSFLSALVLMLILLFVNIILLQHSSLIYEDMPFLSLFSGWQRACINIVTFVGCSTSLFSFVYTSSLSFRGLCNNEFLIFCISVFLPALLSFCGFSFIVSYLYPLISVLGLFLLFKLLWSDKIHYQTKNVNQKLKKTDDI